MAIALDASDERILSQDRLSGDTRTNVIDRWIYVFTAASLIAVVFAGFLPDSFAKVAAVEAGKRPPFPLILHVHAVLMGSFLLLLLAQTVLVATGRLGGHMQLGIAAMVLAPAIVISGLILVPTMYHLAWNAALAAPIAMKEPFLDRLHAIDNVMLRQFSAGILFTVFMAIALRARTRDSGLHKRMIFLSITAVLGAAITRIHWLPTTMPNSSLSLDIFVLLTFSPMFLWDLIRNRGLHRAYFIWASIYFPVMATVHTLWDTPWWHATARHIMGV
ncbi:MAG TPA: hypothetical protein VN175_05130 [Rhizomicrobium sp.]|nr:hypothetical protein [Rhizomicrobium sp.]